MTQKRFMQVDAETGELVEEGFVAYVAPKRKNGFGTRWVAMAQDAFDLMAESNLEGRDWRVFAKLLGRIDFENLMVVNQAEVAKELGMHRQHVQRSIKHLLALGVILEGPKIGVSRSYRLNPEFGWKGSARNHVIALDQERKKRMANAGIKGVIEGGQQGPQEAPERDPNTLDMFSE